MTSPTHDAYGGPADASLVSPWLEVSTGALTWNLEQVRRQVGPTPIMAVVKCNAYGHGTVEVARVLAGSGIDRFAVVTVSEALALRDAGIDGWVLNFGAFSKRDAGRIVEKRISQSVFSESVMLLATAAVEAKSHAKVHIKVDTGMSRVGVPYESAVAFIERVHGLPGVGIEGVFTTLTEEPDFDPIQIQRLKHVCTEAERMGISTGVMHAVGSSGIGQGAEMFLDMVRTGNALYGLEPHAILDVRPALSLKTRVIQVKSLGPGDTIGYHRVRQVAAEMRLATLPIGYADGYPPHAVDKTDVLIRGRRRPVIAYISANHTLVDVTDSDVQLDDEVVLVGSQGGHSITLDEIADRTNMSVYQLATGLSPLLPRLFVP